ncbi:MAG: hypothetical protein Q8O13_00360 [Candidatus Omnitrophota bacterium]|nr:hypothetical protein [Candidatus Omnitrophota bacterium]
MDEKRKSMTNDELARMMFLNFPARMRNLTVEEKQELDLFLTTGKTESILTFGCKQVIRDPVLFLRIRRAVEKYGDVVIDIMNDVLCGFPEDGINVEELPKEEILRGLLKKEKVRKSKKNRGGA